MIKIRASILALVVSAGLGASLVCAAPRSPAPQSAEATPARSWTMEQAATSSVREAWVLGGKTEAGFFEIVKALTELSAQKRGVTLPDNEKAGVWAGNWIKKQAKKDPDQLLYVIVDRSVQYNARKAQQGQ